MHKLLGTAVVGGALALAAPGAALAQQAGTFTVSPTTVQAGGTVQVSGQCPGGAGGEDQVAVLAGTGFPEPGQLGEVPVEETGAFAGTITIPAGAPAASGEIRVPCPTGGAENVLVANLTITAAGDGAQMPAGGGAQMPAGGVSAGAGGGAGSDPTAAVLGTSGVLLVLAGGALAWRRRTA